MTIQDTHHWFYLSPTSSASFNQLVLGVFGVCKRSHSLVNHKDSYVIYRNVEILYVAYRVVLRRLPYAEPRIRSGNFSALIMASILFAMSAYEKDYLLSALTLSRDHKATDSRDKVYGVQGMLHQAFLSRLFRYRSELLKNQSQRSIETLSQQSYTLVMICTSWNTSLTRWDARSG